MSEASPRRRSPPKPDEAPRAVEPVEEVAAQIIQTLAPQKPPQVVMQEKLEAIATGVTALLAAHAEQQQFATEVTDFRQTMFEALTVLDSQGRDLLAQLDRLNQRESMGQGAGPGARPRRWVWGGGGCLVGLLLCAGAWAMWPPSAQTRLLFDLDQVLEQSVTQLPKPVQDRLVTLYRARGFAPPGQRSKGGG
jgi:hypothetical protein